MNDAGNRAQALLRVEEQLRQERETFDQRKHQEAEWFALRLRMGYVAAFMLPGIGGVAAFVILNEAAFSKTVVSSAAAALLIDIVGLLGAVWKIVLNASGAMPLEPITTDSRAPDVQGVSDDRHDS